MAKKNGASFSQCPEGHRLPNILKGGARCTPIVCAEGSKALAKTKPDDNTDEDMLGKEQKKLALRKAQRDARREIVEVPADLSGEAAEQWADEKITKMLPKAVAELEYQLEFGSDEQRERAANKILDATGRGKSDKGGGGGAPIILLNMQPGQLPWAQRVDKKDQADILPSEVKKP